MNDLVLDVAADPRWVPLALEGDVDAESEALAAEVLRIRDDVTTDPADVTALLAGLARQVRALAAEDPESPVAGAFALLPEAEPVSLGVALLRVAAGTGSLDDVAAALVAPPDERCVEPAVEGVSTPLGEAVRVTQRLVAADDTVRAWLGYAWPLPDGDVTLVLSVSFLDLVEAARWADAFDDLARGVNAWVEG